MLVCHCFVVHDRRIRAAVAAGAQTVDEVTDMESAGGLCGGCHLAICKLLGDHGPGDCGSSECAVADLRQTCGLDNVGNGPRRINAG